MITPQRITAGLLRTGALALLSLTALGFSSTTSIAQPRIQIVGGDAVNWGRIATDTLRHKIQIVNVGNQPLEIKEVRPSCGCTTTEKLSKNTLAPNDTATVGIAINVKGHHGPQMKKVTIVSNDPDSARANLGMSFQADLIQDIAASASMFSMVRGARLDSSYVSTVELKNVGEETISINPPKAVETEAVAITFDMKSPKTLKPGEKMDVVANVKPKKEGMHTSDILVTTSGKITPSLALKLMTQVMPLNPAPQSASAPAPAQKK